jgi:hypothetical protein
LVAAAGTENSSGAVSKTVFHVPASSSFLEDPMCKILRPFRDALEQEMKNNNTCYDAKRISKQTSSYAIFWQVIG